MIDPKWTRETLVDLNLNLQVRLAKVEEQLARAQEDCDHKYPTEWVWVSLHKEDGKYGVCSHCSRIMVSAAA